jgi:hypothetical protein
LRQNTESESESEDTEEPWCLIVAMLKGVRYLELVEQAVPAKGTTKPQTGQTIEDDDVRRLVREERLGRLGGGDPTVSGHKRQAPWNPDEQMAQSIVSKKHRKTTGDDDELFDEIDEAKLIAGDEDSNRKRKHGKKGAKEQTASSSSSQMISGSGGIDQNCFFCIQSDRAKTTGVKHMIQAIGLSMYLTVPRESPLVEGECCLTSIEHQVSRMHLSPEQIEELFIFQRRIVNMFHQQKKGVVFLEIVRNLDKRRHWQIQCIPVKQSAFDEAPLFFKKGILDADLEFGSNKKIIDTHMTEQPAHKAIPANFPYFHVQFGLGKGFIHTIEDEGLFDWKFGKEIICSLLDLPAQILIRTNQRPEPEDQQRKRAKEFLKQWQPFDWTVELDGGEY